MSSVSYPVISLEATGRNIQTLRCQRGLSVKDVQAFFGFDSPQAVYKWQRGQSLPTVDNLLALSRLLDVGMEELLVTTEKHEEPTGSVFLRIIQWASKLYFPSTSKGWRKQSACAMLLHATIG